MCFLMFFGSCVMMVGNVFLMVLIVVRRLVVGVIWILI